MHSAADVWHDLELLAEEQRHEWQLNWIAEEYERRRRMEEGAARLVLEAEAAESREDAPRGWVVRLGSYLRIFGGRGDAGQPEHRYYIDRLAEKAKEREAEHGRGV